jgi:peptide/nickel transport system permease protein
MSHLKEARLIRRAGRSLLAAVLLMVVFAGLIAPNDPEQRFDDHLFAPPTRVHLWDTGPSRPFIYRQRLVSRLERRFEDDQMHKVPLRWMENGRLVTTADSPLLLLGADSYGRDIFARVVHGGRISLTLALVAALGAVAVGSILGGIAGYAGGWLDTVISRSSEFLLVLPTMYVVLVLRAVLPLALEARTVFVLLALILTALGWPIVARGTRTIVASEREREYIEAARAVGAQPVRVLLKHLLPSASKYLLTQLTLLIPAFILAEATLSYVGFGFPPETATWGTMLKDAGNILLVADLPWLLAPAVAIFLTVLAINLLVQATGRPPVQLEG